MKNSTSTNNNKNEYGADIMDGCNKTKFIKYCLTASEDNNGSCSTMKPSIPIKIKIHRLKYSMGELIALILLSSNLITRMKEGSMIIIARPMRRIMPMCNPIKNATNQKKMSAIPIWKIQPPIHSLLLLLNTLLKVNISLSIKPICSAGVAGMGYKDHFNVCGMEIHLFILSRILAMKITTAKYGKTSSIKKLIVFICVKSPYFLF
ncbi:MAG: hypothetical protein ACP5JP_01145 [bacterium]